MTTSTLLPSPPAAQLAEASRSRFSAHIPELDGIRGIAIGMVVFYHYIVLNIIPPRGSFLWYVLLPGHLGWAGVDLFFVLSGFLIGGILLDARTASNYFRVFYTRRFFHIVPIYAVFLSCFFLFLLFNNTGHTSKLHWMTEGSLPWYSYVLFLQNFWMAFANTGGPFATTITWSLAVEEQFYLTLPFIIRFLSKKRLVQVLWEGLAAALVLRIALYCLWPNLNYSWFVLMPCRADALLFGVLAAVGLRETEWRNWLQRNRTLLRILLFLLAASVCAFTRMYYAPYGFGIASLGLTSIAAFSAVFIVYALVFPDSFLSGCLRWAWLRKLGGLAYGVYLFHQLVYLLIYSLLWSHSASLTAGYQVLLASLAFTATLLICQLSWTFFEKPLVAIGHDSGYDFGGRLSEHIAAQQSGSVFPVQGLKGAPR